MGLFSKPAPMPVLAPPPPAPTPPSFASSAVQGAGDRTASAGASAFGSTIATSPQGDLTPANTAKKTLLGQ